MNTYLAYDCETGGLRPENSSLLTAYFAMFDEGFNKTCDLSLMIKQPSYHVTPGALKVNRIDIVAHHAAAEPIEICRTKLFDFLNIGRQLVPVGHNVEFDTEFVDFYFPGFRSKISHRKLDTAVIGRFLKLQGKVPEPVSTLGSYAAHFGISINAHDAQSDTLATVQLLQRFIAT